LLSTFSQDCATGLDIDVHQAFPFLGAAGPVLAVSSYAPSRAWAEDAPKRQTTVTMLMTAAMVAAGRGRPPAAA